MFCFAEMCPTVFSPKQKRQLYQDDGWIQLPGVIFSKSTGLYNIYVFHIDVGLFIILFLGYKCFFVSFLISTTLVVFSQSAFLILFQKWSKQRSFRFTPVINLWVWWIEEAVEGLRTWSKKALNHSRQSSWSSHVFVVDPLVFSRYSSQIKITTVGPNFSQGLGTTAAHEWLKSAKTWDSI